MVITGSVVNWGLIWAIWEIAAYAALGCAVFLVTLYLLRKKINKATFALWRGPKVAHMMRATRRPRGR